MSPEILRVIGWIAICIGTNVASFLAGRWSERAETERKIKNIREQILILSNRSASIENRYQKLLYACAMYELSLKKASESGSEEVQELVEEFELLSKLLREANAGFWERIKIKFQIEKTKKNLLKVA